MLKDRCHINTNRKTDTFVGLEFDGKDYTVSFPLGYAIASEDDDKLLREDLLLLFHTLALYSSQTESKSGFKREKDAATETPMYAYIYIIMDFVTRGYYKEGIVEYASSKRGKIHWNRTIKQKKPVIQEADIYYLDFITKKNVINENDLITLIHQYCVYLSFIASAGCSRITNRPSRKSRSTANGSALRCRKSCAVPLTMPTRCFLPIC